MHYNPINIDHLHIVHQQVNGNKDMCNRIAWEKERLPRRYLKRCLFHAIDAMGGGFWHTQKELYGCYVEHLITSTWWQFTVFKLCQIPKKHCNYHTPASLFVTQSCNTAPIKTGLVFCISENPVFWIHLGMYMRFTFKQHLPFDLHCIDRCLSCGFCFHSYSANPWEWPFNRQALLGGFRFVGQTLTHWFRCQNRQCI